MPRVNYENFDVVIIGAGAAGLMCAIEAGKRGRSVLVIDHAKKPAEKIRISGGGRCNFTNIHASPENFLSQNPHFCKSALKRYTQFDFIAMVERHGIPYHEKKLGQLFCDNRAQDIIDMLLRECAENDLTIAMETSVSKIQKQDDIGFALQTSIGDIICQSLVVACGGLSIPKIGATGFGYNIARQFGHNIVDTRPALVPLTFNDDVLEMCKSLSGLSVEASIGYNSTHFAEGLLFTHRGLSGPSILQISSYWQDNSPIMVNLTPQVQIFDYLKACKITYPKQDIQNIISDILPKRLAHHICDYNGFSGRIADLPHDVLSEIAAHINQWAIVPNGTEGYRTAEVTLGGVDTDELSSKTMESTIVNGLYFIGEVVDVTGHLGGFNFQWAWSSGWAAGQVV